MERTSSTAWAGFAVACGVLLAALPRGGARPAACPHPVLRAPAEVVCVPGGTRTPRLAGPARRLFGLPVDPNRADPVTLETLPGIGPARARAILAERKRRPFTSLADLQRVYGLGPARVAALAPHVGFEPALAGEDRSSVASPTCRSSCGGAAAGMAVPGEPAGEGP